MFSLFGVLLYILTHKLLKLVKDNGKLQKNILKCISVFYIGFGFFVIFVKFERTLIATIAIVVPWIIYLLFDT